MKTRITIILFTALAILLLVFFIWNSGDDHRYQWNENYRGDNTQPYGTLFIRKLLEGYRQGKNFILNDKKPLHDVLVSLNSSKKTDYVFIGQSLYLTNADITALADFISKGGDAFIAS